MADKEKLLDKVGKDEDEIPIGEEPEKDDADEEELPPAAAKPVSGRDEKRRDRFREAKETARQAEARAREYEQRTIQAEARAAAAETAHRMEMERQRALAKPEEDPLDKEDKRLAREQQDILDHFPTATPEKQKEMRDRAMAISSERQRIIAEQVYRKNGPSQDTVTSNNVQQHITRTFILNNFPDVVGDGVAMADANARWMKLRRDGHPDTQETLSAAFSAAREEAFGKQNGNGSRKAPSAAEKRGTTGVSTGAGGGLGAAPGRKTYTMTTADKKMARAAFPGMSEPDAYRKYVNEYRPWETE